MVEAAGIEPETIYSNLLLLQGYINFPDFLGRYWVVFLSIASVFFCQFYF